MDCKSLDLVVARMERSVIREGARVVRYRRNLLPGGTFFFTVTLDDRRSSVLVDHVDKLRHAFRVARAERPFTIEAIVVLPDHLHVIMTLPDNDADFSGRWRRIKSSFTHQLAVSGAPISRNRRGEFSLWQRRFWEHTIRDDADFERCADYIHFNPAKHGYVSSPADWPHSSLHRYVREGVLPPDWGGAGEIVG
ncbi:putative transposase [Bradyrhizobium sp. GM6.1]